MASCLCWKALELPPGKRPGTKEVPVSEENKALVRRQEEDLFSGGNLDVADEIYASDYRQAFPDLRVTVEDLIAEGDRVAAHLRFRGTHLGELDGIAPTGRRVDCTGIVVSRIEEGKIAEDWANFDDLGMMQQLGLIPEPGQRPTSTS